MIMLDVCWLFKAASTLCTDKIFANVVMVTSSVKTVCQHLVVHYKSFKMILDMVTLTTRHQLPFVSCEIILKERGLHRRKEEKKNKINK